MERQVPSWHRRIGAVGKGVKERASVARGELLRARPEDRRPIDAAGTK